MCKLHSRWGSVILCRTVSCGMLEDLWVCAGSSEGTSHGDRFADNWEVHNQKEIGKQQGGHLWQVWQSKLCDTCVQT